MNKFDQIRDYVMVDRKPFDTEELVANNYNVLPSHIKQMLDELPVVHHKPNFDEGGSGFFEYFLDGKVQFYLVKFDGRTFFVDTQGYDYARYVGEIIYQAYKTFECIFNQLKKHNYGIK